MSRSKKDIYEEIKDVKLEIKESRQFGAEALVEKLYLELDKLEEEYHNASSYFSSVD